MSLFQIQLPGERTFTVRFWATLLTVLLVVGLVGLGNWQIERLHWKQEVLFKIKSQERATPIDVEWSDPQTSFDYYPGKVAGILDNNKEFYLNAMSIYGQAGYHILTPLRMANGHSILVDRGWVPTGLRSPINRPESQPTGNVVIQGILHVPEKRHWMQPDNDVRNNEWFWIDLPVISKMLQEQLPPYVLEADATSNEGGYPVGGQAIMNIPNNHLVYAVTWYGLALVILIIYGISALKPED